MKKQESILQQNCIIAFRYQYPLLANRLWAVPNGGWRNIATAVRLKKEGVISGVPDLVLSIPRQGYGALFIEMKAAKGRLSPAQIDFIKSHGSDYKFVVIRSVDEFLREIKAYLTLKKKTDV
jgi:hypothetical protein